ncbi:hypothetical protein V7128_02075 [Neobacillus vireti]|uniref:hypothetical protein n=1 Tax=Neobacillus vireti TaxID=220686 RepID=UPI002FFFC9B4
MVRPRTNIGKCIVNGCDKDAEKEMMCSKHYSRKWKYGNENFISINERYKDTDKCLVIGCNNKPDAQKLCPKHYHNFMYHKRKGNLETISEYLKKKTGDN